MQLFAFTNVDTKVSTDYDNDLNEGMYSERQPIFLLY